MKIFSTKRALRGIDKSAGKSRSHRFTWLSTDKAPLYVSFFFAALAWTLVRTADRIAATPIVEFSVQPHSESFARDGPDRVIGVRLRNMTLAHPVSCLVVYLNATSDIPFQFTAVTPSTYRINGHVHVRAYAQILDSSNAQFDLQSFPPGADVEFGLRAKGEGTLNIKAKPCDAPTGTEAAATMPVIVERSVKTRLIERELQVLWSGLALWALALIGLAIARTGRAKSGDR
jgi:hypothetical protein